MLVANCTCSYVLNDMLAIHQNGTSTISRNATRPMIVNARVVIGFAVGPPAQASGARRSGSEPTRSFPLSQQIAAYQRDRDHHHRHEEDPNRHAAPPAQLIARPLVATRRKH